jgi:hypothetical protein
LTLRKFYSTNKYEKASFDFRACVVYLWRKDWLICRSGKKVTKMSKGRTIFSFPFSLQHHSSMCLLNEREL